MIICNDAVKHSHREPKTDSAGASHCSKMLSCIATVRLCTHNLTGTPNPGPVNVNINVNNLQAISI